MPAEQKGSVYKTSGGFGIRWFDECGVRRRKAGFQSRSEARAWFWDVERKRMREGPRPERLTLAAFTDRYLAWYSTSTSKRTGQTVSRLSVETLRWRLARPLELFGGRDLDDLRTGEIAAWESTLPPRFRHAVVRALRQVLDAAVAWEYLDRNPAKATGANPAPEVLERAVLEPRDIDRLAAELLDNDAEDAARRENSRRWAAAIVVGAWCYLRPSELFALERRDIDTRAGVLHVRRTLDHAGGTKPSAKTRRSLRTVPLPARAAEAVDQLPVRLDTRFLFPGPAGGVHDLRNFRRREFDPAREAAGLAANVTPYTLRHSGLSWALAAGVPPSDVARFGGTSVTMLERVYAHLLEASADRARARLDAFGSFAQRNVATVDA